MNEWFIIHEKNSFDSIREESLLRLHTSIYIKKKKKRIKTNSIYKQLDEY